MADKKKAVKKAKVNTKQTSPVIASKAGKGLENTKTSKTQKGIDASAVAQAHFHKPVKKSVSKVKTPTKTPGKKGKS